MTLLTALSGALLLLAHCCSISAMVTSGSLPSECPSCALSRLRRGGPEAPAVEEAEAQQDVVEAVKRHILSMLHLQARPNITHPVPRAALLNAIRKVHVGRVAQDGSVLIDDEPHSRQEAESGEQTEIITFAEAGESLLHLHLKPQRPVCVSIPHSCNYTTHIVNNEHKINNKCSEF